MFAIFQKFYVFFFEISCFFSSNFLREKKVVVVGFPLSLITLPEQMESTSARVRSLPKKYLWVYKHFLEQYSAARDTATSSKTDPRLKTASAVGREGRERERGIAASSKERISLVLGPANASPNHTQLPKSYGYWLKF